MAASFADLFGVIVLLKSEGYEKFDKSITNFRCSISGYHIFYRTCTFKNYNVNFSTVNLAEFFIVRR